MTKDKCINYLEYLLCFLMIFNCRTVYAHMVGHNIGDMITVMLVLVLLALICLKANKKIKIKAFLFIAILLFYLGIYFFVNVKTNQIAFIKNFFVVLPLCILYFLTLEMDEIKGILKKYASIIIAIATCSLFFYLFGSCMKLLHPNTTITFEWGLNQTVEGYFFLHFDTQTTWVFGKTILRNTGIFVEGPMYSLQLILAYAFMLFENKKTINRKSIILAITLFTTLSTTGIIVFIILTLYKWLKSNDKATKTILFPIIFVIGVISILVVFQDKKNADINSYSIRNDDIQVAMTSLKNNPIFGDGFTNNEIAVSNMSSFRLYNTGLSSTFVIILIQGGIYLSIFYLLPMILLTIKSYKKKNYIVCAIAMAQILLYFTTTFQYTELMMFMIAFNINYILNSKLEKKEEDKILLMESEIG